MSSASRSEPILVFQANDRPPAELPQTYDRKSLTLTITAPGMTMAIVWQGTRLSKDSFQARNARLREGKDSSSADVILMSRVCLVSPKSYNAPPEHVEGVDLRTNAGRRLDNKRREYGVTYSNPPTKPANLSQESLYEEKAERMKRKREQTELDIDNELKARRRSEEAENEDVLPTSPPAKKRQRGTSRRARK